MTNFSKHKIIGFAYFFIAKRLCWILIDCDKYSLFTNYRTYLKYMKGFCLVVPNKRKCTSFDECGLLSDENA